MVCSYAASDVLSVVRSYAYTRTLRVLCSYAYALTPETGMILRCERYAPTPMLSIVLSRGMLLCAESSTERGLGREEARMWTKWRWQAAGTAGW
eukprot:1611890-Rhodomonas_salina.1